MGYSIDAARPLHLSQRAGSENRATSAIVGPIWHGCTIKAISEAGYLLRNCFAFLLPISP